MAVDYQITSRAANPGTTTGYHQIQSGDTTTAWGGTESRVRDVFSDTGTLKNFRVSLNTAPGAGKTRTFTVYKNGSATAIVVAISDANTTGQDLVNTVSFTAGDTISLESTATAASTASAVRWTLIWNGNYNPFMWGNTAAGPAAGVTAYFPIMGELVSSATELNVTSPMPTGGTLKNLYISLDANLTGSGGSWAVTVRKNEASTGLTLTLSAGSAAANVASDVSVSQGDRITYEIVANGSTTNTPRVRLACSFDPTTPGESCTFVAASLQQDQATTRYNNFGGGNDGATGKWGSTESGTQTLLQACTVKNLTTYTQGPIASGQTVVFTGRLNAADASPSITCTATGDGAASIAANDNTHAPTAANDDLLSIQAATSATSGTVRAAVGLVLYIAPTTSTVRTLASLGVGT